MSDKPVASPPAMHDEEDETGPIRRCIATGERLAKERMVRCAVDPDGVIVADVAAALPGRGLWLTARRDIVALAIKKRAFDRAAKRQVKVPVDLADRIEALLALRCRDGIGLARRSGQAVAGFEKVGQEMRAGRVGLLLAASDGAENGRQKIAGLARGLDLGIEIMAVLTAGELGVAFGRDHVVHAALGPGALATRLRQDGARLAGFRDIGVTPAGFSKRHA
ncbi:MAG: RNA-binding protein [Aliidongia sp.]